MTFFELCCILSIDRKRGSKMLNELMNIIKEFATHKNRVWFYNSITMQRVEVKRDAYRRYYMSPIHFRNEETTLSRMAYNDFINNIEYLMKHNFYICY